ncbi:MAG: hypothetical protein ACJ77K_19265 [Bacteroidia bacterium]
MPITVKFREPSMKGTDCLSDAIIKHFKFVNRSYFDEIYLVMKEIAELLSVDYNKVETITGFRFKIGDIIYYHKKGNVHIIVPDKLLDLALIIARKYFRDVDSEKEYEYDEDSVIVINLT